MSTFTETTKETFPFALTDTELLDRANAASSLSAELKQKQNVFLAIKKAKKAEIDVIADELDHLMQIILEKKEDRQVDCQKVYDTSQRKVVYLFRGEVMAERPMDNSEYNFAVQRAQDSPAASL